MFEVEFDYKRDIGIPGARHLHIRLPQQLTNNNIATIHLERMQGSLIIDTSRKSSSKLGKNQTTSVKKVPKNTNTIRVDLFGSEPLYYRLNRYTKIVAPSYRTKVTIRLISNTRKQTHLLIDVRKYFNQLLKVYRVVTGDPVTLLDEDDNNDLGMVHCRYVLLPPNHFKTDANIGDYINTLEQSKPTTPAPETASIKSTEIDMAPKLYIKEHVLQIVKYLMLPEELELYKEPIMEAIEKAYRYNDYAMGVILLNNAFDAAITMSIIGSLIFIGYDNKMIDKFFDDNPSLEDKRKVIDEVRQKACEKYGVAVPKPFRASGEESRWYKSTYEKRNWNVHIVRDKNARPLKRKDFTDALKHTQSAINAVALPHDELKAARKAQNDVSK
jgi:hypothetical protein